MNSDLALAESFGYVMASGEYQGHLPVKLVLSSKEAYNYFREKFHWYDSQKFNKKNSLHEILDKIFYVLKRVEPVATCPFCHNHKVRWIAIRDLGNSFESLFFNGLPLLNNISCEKCKQTLARSFPERELHLISFGVDFNGQNKKGLYDIVSRKKHKRHSLKGHEVTALLNILYGITTSYTEVTKEEAIDFFVYNYDKIRAKAS